MKKILSSLISIFLLFSFIISAQATDIIDTSNDYTVVEYFSDGSYITTTIVEDTIMTRSSNTKSGTKTVTYSDSDGEVLWKAFLKGTFTYNGSSSSCTASSITHSIYDTDWKITSATASRSGNKAIGDITAKRYFIGIPTATIEKTVTLSCSANGTLS